jgi:UDP-N-acetylmuramyl-tripeptide synthetase
MKRIIRKFLNIYHFFIALIANVFYRFPSNRLFLIGITGTKGKTTTVELLAHTLRFAGFKVASLSSIRETVNEKEELNKTGNTMPGRGYIFKFLKKAADEKCEVAIVEVTSIGVTQYRDKFLNWDVGFFLGIHPEHIEEHGSFEKYRNAKVKFFKNVLNSSKPRKYFFINKEDENYNYFLKPVEGKKGVEVFLFSKDDFIEKMKALDWDLSNVEEREMIASWLVPDFNLINAAAVYSFASFFEVAPDLIKGAFKNFTGAPGRFEFVYKKPLIVVDYAHTPQSLEFLYDTLRKFYKKEEGKIIAVLGSAGGGRDKWKRPVMGEIAARFCDIVILTNEDPYDENPKEIILNIKTGIDNFLEKNDKKIEVFEVEDRKEALKKAISIADYKDIIVVTGKGSERFIHLEEGRLLPWNEKEVIISLLREMRK